MCFLLCVTVEFGDDGSMNKHADALCTICVLVMHIGAEHTKESDRNGASHTSRTMGTINGGKRPHKKCLCRVPLADEARLIVASTAHV